MTASYLPLWESLRSEQFDPLALWQRVGEDTQLLCELVRIFTAEYPEIIRRIEQALQVRDAAQLQKASHLLKGSLLQLSAFGAAGAAAELEDSASRSRLESSSQLIEKVKIEIDCLMQMLKTMTSSIQKSSSFESGG